MVIVVLAILGIAFALGRPQNTETGAVALQADRVAAQKEPIAAETAYSLDVITVGNKSSTVNQDENPVVVMPMGQGLRLVGWAIDRASNEVAGGVSAEIDRGPDIAAVYGQDRPDVAIALKNLALKASGFTIDVPPKGLPRGKHFISLKILKSDKSGYYLVKNKVSVTVE